MRIRGKKIRTGISFKGKRKSKGAPLEISINFKKIDYGYNDYCNYSICNNSSCNEQHFNLEMIALCSERNL